MSKLADKNLPQSALASIPPDEKSSSVTLFLGRFSSFFMAVFYGISVRGRRALSWC
jgi:hypothetical protein